MTKKFAMEKLKRQERFAVRDGRPASAARLSPLGFLWLLAGLFALGGAGCAQMLQRYTNPLPRVLPPSPTLQQVIEVVNRNSSQIQSFSTSHASISGRDFPTLGASVAFERSRRFRLQAGTGLTGTELDVGSNDELFWVWMRRNQPPAEYYCRHDQFASSPAKRSLPFEPTWLIEALGVTQFDLALPHQGPKTLPNDRLRIDTILNTPEGPVTKITILDGSQGWVLEQYVYDARRQLLASSIASGHRRDPLSGLVMPTVVNITCPPAQLAMRIDLGPVEINRPAGDPASLWSMPNYPNTPLVNLADPNSYPPVASGPRAANRGRRMAR
ncbi:MAG: hypothetical protein LLF97_00195 [Planctomycetaceae bacterium]|nr:hypothetical protein [Planctomycetaceae bacterium]